MKIVTYNLRCVYAGDGVNSFVHRAGLILDTIQAEKPDILCFQEATEKNIGFLRRYLAPTYTMLYNQREQGLSGEGLAVAYRTDKVSLYGLEVFWLSPTPQVIASKFPGQSKHSRICQDLLFKNEQTGNTFRIYNLHLEEITEEVRVQQMALVLDRLATVKEPAVLLGDLNTQPNGKVLPYCQKAGLTDLTWNIPHSFHNFGRRDPYIKLDYILALPDTAAHCSDVRIWDQCVNGIYLSDHYPISFEFDL
jgi:endonuclease/exonuclease/phosphatase family metal-dependent hydrolase